MAITLDGTNGITFNNSTVQASAGQVLQVVNVPYSTTVTTAVATLSDTGITATITPKFATSKILVSVNVTSCYSSATGTYAYFALFRNSTSIVNFDIITGYSTTGGSGGSTGTSFLDSPATTAATTYKVQWLRQAGAGTVYINNGNSSSTITLMEIAG
jgi:hypothetical protein